MGVHVSTRISDRHIDYLLAEEVVERLHERLAHAEARHACTHNKVNGAREYSRLYRWRVALVSLTSTTVCAEKAAQHARTHLMHVITFSTLTFVTSVVATSLLAPSGVTSAGVMNRKNTNPPTAMR
jgi:hypothetical protein